MRAAPWTAAWTAALAVAALTAPAARGYLPPRYGGVVTSTLPDRPVTLDPARATRDSELQLIPLLFDTLYRLDARDVVRPHLVAYHERSADGRTWKLHLRHGVATHDQQLLDARHVEAALKRVLRGTNGYLLGPVDSVTATADDQLEVRLRRKANLPLLLSAPATSVVIPRHGKLVGSGPFHLASWRAAEIRLRAHRTHFAGRPYVDELRFQLHKRAAAQRAAFQMGKLQLSFHGTSAHGGQPRHPYAAIESEVVSTVLLRVGGGRSYLADPLFRLALLKGIDRSRLRRVAGTGRAQVAASPVARYLLKRSRLRLRARPAPFDRSAANKLLGRLVQRNAQLRQDASQTGKLRLALLVDASRFEDQVVAGQLVADLDRIGITTSIDAQPAPGYQKRLESGQFQLALTRQALQLPDLKVALAGALAASGQPRAAHRCLAGKRCDTKQIRLFNKELPALPLVHASTRVYHDSRLGELQISKDGRICYADIFWTRGSP